MKGWKKFFVLGFGSFWLQSPEISAKLKKFYFYKNQVYKSLAGEVMPPLDAMF